MKIQKIGICNFKGFRGHYEFELNNPSKNLLVFGENGSGKSSLYWALKLFLNSSGDTSLDFSRNKNIFNPIDQEGYIKFLFDDGQEYTWSDTQNDVFNTPKFIDANKASGFIDYKALLNTYFLPNIGGKLQANIFTLLIDLLSSVINDYTGNTFGEDWESINANIPKRNSENRLQIVNENIDRFNIGFKAKLSELLGLSNEILSHFSYQIELIELFFSKLFYDKPSHSIDGKFVELKVRFQSSEINEHHKFLNEAKLSAIAISIYFASLLLVPETDLRILVLDDILIGLDMSNRFPIIKILNERFDGFQIFLFTYDQAWFEIIGLYMNDSAWKSIELYCDTSHGFEMPMYVENKAYLEKAKEHLSKKDYKASVVYVRSAFEHILKKFCKENRLLVKFRDKQRKYSSVDFWEAVNNENGLVPDELKKEIEVHRTHILNPLCHDDPVLAVEIEIQKTIQIIEVLMKVFQEANKTKLLMKAQNAYGGKEQLLDAISGGK